MRIALIHAVQVAMPPVAQAFAHHWPEAELVNLLDGALSVDRERATDLTPAMTQRIDALADYAQSLGAAGILFTCSAFGPAIEATRTRRDLPVLKPNEAMFERALAQGPRLGLLATFAPSVALMEDELRAAAARAGRRCALRTVCVPEAFAGVEGGRCTSSRRSGRRRCRRVRRRGYADACPFLDVARETRRRTCGDRAGPHESG